MGGAYTLASWDWCGAWPARPPAVVQRGTGEGGLRAGAARTELMPPFPVEIAGYGLFRPEANRAASPLFARALVLQAGETKVALVTLDVMTLSDEVVSGVRTGATALGLTETWVVATHPHSSMGGYDPRPLAGLMGIHSYREAVRAALVDGALSALRSAVSGLKPATLALGEGNAPDLVNSRAPGLEADTRLTRVALRGEQGNIAELTVFSAHPTLEPRDLGALSADYPGAFCQAREAAGAGTCLLLLGAVGNARAHVSEEAAAPATRARDFGEQLARVAAQTPLREAPATRLAFISTRVALPRPDASRLVPWSVRAPGDNLLCQATPREAEVSALDLGPLRLLAVSGEVTYPAALALESAARATRLVSAANGYLGYVDTAEHVRAGVGESRRQYFGPALEETLRDAARTVGEAL